MNGFRSPKEAQYVLIQDLATLSTHNHDRVIKVTLGKWNGEVRLDIRYWCNGELGKGISLNEEQVRRLRAVLARIPFGC